MRKLVESTFVSLDGIISDTRPSTTSRAEPQMWGNRYWDEQHNGLAAKLVGEADTLLMGRVTFEAMAEAWAGQSNPFADKVNGMTKYMASRTRTEAPWGGVVLGDDVAEEVAKIKEQPGANILKWGTGTLDRTLVEHGLVAGDLAEDGELAVHRARLMMQQKTARALARARRAGDDHDRRALGIGACDRVDEIERTRAVGHDSNADAAMIARGSVGSEADARLMAQLEMRQDAALFNHFVKRQNEITGNAENLFRAVILQSVQQSGGQCEHNNSRRCVGTLAFGCR